MKTRMKTRKGLSPLVATILLIAFSVALGTMIMNWSIDSGHDDVKDPCADINLELQQLAQGNAICYEAQSQLMRFSIKNPSSQELHFVQMRVIDSQQNIFEEKITTALAAGGLAKFEVAYRTVNPNSLTAAIIPGVLVNGEPLLCPAAEIEQVGVTLC